MPALSAILATMIDIFKQAKINQEVLHFKNFQKPEISWEDAMKFVYDLSKIPNEDIMTRASKSGGIGFGSVIAIKGYFLFDENNLFSTFKGVRDLMTKVNGGNSSEGCPYYSTPIKTCTCGAMWHIQTLRLSISDHGVMDHNDPNNVLYWQLLGTSYWKMNKDKVYKLEPGDLLYFNKEDSHEVWQDGPRAGIIIDSDKYPNSL
jgi:hypothetical protein